jgi:hypothetical protein
VCYFVRSVPLRCTPGTGDGYIFPGRGCSGKTQRNREAKSFGHPITWFRFTKRTTGFNPSFPSRPVNFYSQTDNAKQVLFFIGDDETRIKHCYDEIKINPACRKPRQRAVGSRGGTCWPPGSRFGVTRRAWAPSRTDRVHLAVAGGGEPGLHVVEQRPLARRRGSRSPPRARPPATGRTRRGAPTRRSPRPARCGT